ncbi:sodium:solute symporter family protein [Flexithrix dorotheae]|uniref:sodium:solute symporter family protein n=1 Tax=Flexithrix dorotheae TaxID=70993 RepID=UPI00035E9DDD|nr:sodium:solute symporter family protein [Flexithrix dorotheae]
MKSFFAAGGAVPYWISGLSLFMSFFSAGTFVVWGSIAYTEGFVAITIQSTMCIAGVVIALFIAPKWNKTKTITAAQFITERLGYNTQKLYTYFFLFISMVTTGAFLYPVAKIVEVSTAIPLVYSIIGLGVLITIYTAVGGLWAVIVTDVLQFIVLTTAVLLVVPLAINKVGGVNSFIQASPEGFFNLVNEEYSWTFIAGMIFYHIVFIGGNWAYVQRFTSVASPRDSKKVAWLFSGLYLISPLIWMLPPMIYRVINPDLNGLADEGAYLMVCKEVLPKGLLGLMLGGMIFATSSSVNTTLNISAGVFTNDIFKRLFKHISEQKTMNVARIATFVFGIITITVALLVPKMGGIVEVVLSLASLTGGAMFLPPIWAMFSKNQTGKNVLAVTVISLLLNIFFKFIAPQLFGFSFSRGMEMLVGVMIPFGLLSLSELYFMYTGKDNETYSKYIDALTTRINKESQEVMSSETTNQKGRSIIAKGIFSIGLLVIGLGFIAEFANNLVIGLGAIILLVAFIIYPRKQNIKNHD